MIGPKLQFLTKITILYQTNDFNQKLGFLSKIMFGPKLQFLFKITIFDYYTDFQPNFWIFLTKLKFRQEKL